MDIKAIRELVREGEHFQLEFKRKVTHPEKIIREAVAFANSSGGHLLIGVDDNGSIPGLKFADEDVFALNKALDTMCKPRLKYHYEIIPLDATEERAVVIYDIPESKRKPHYALNAEGEKAGKAYVRVADRSIQASREVREIIRREGRGKGTGFHYGEKEKLLMQHLEENGRITLSRFADLAKIPKRLAGKTLILLTLSKVLEVYPSDKEDYYKICPEDKY